MKKKYLLNKYPLMADARMIKEAGQDIPKQEKMYRTVKETYKNDIHINCQIKEGILMSFPRDDFAPGTFYVLEQGIGYLITEIDRHFFPAFPDQVKTIIFKIHVIHIKAHQFRHTDPCA